MVLLLERDTLVRVSLAAFLRDEGFRVREARNDPEALSLLRQSDGAAVLVADRRPGPSSQGVVATEAALATWPDVSVIYSDDTPEDRAGRRLGHRERVLPKPFFPNRLVQLVREVAGTR